MSTKFEKKIAGEMPSERNLFWKCQENLIDKPGNEKQVEKEFWKKK